MCRGFMIQEEHIAEMIGSHDSILTITDSLAAE